MKLSIDNLSKEKAGGLAFINGKTDEDGYAFVPKHKALLPDSAPRKSKVLWAKVAAAFIIFILVVAVAVLGLLKYEIDQVAEIHRERPKTRVHEIHGLHHHFPHHFRPGQHNMTSRLTGHRPGDQPMRREHGLGVERHGQDVERHGHYGERHGRGERPLAASRAEFMQRLLRLNGTFPARGERREPTGRGRVMARERGRLHFPTGYGPLHLPNGARPARMQHLPQKV